MERLSYAISKLLIEEHGQHEFLRRMSDPLWFQAFGCVLGFDWHSSGLTTVVTGVLKQALKSDTHGVMFAGGKGSKAMNTVNDIAAICEAFNLSDAKLNELAYVSRISAKIDNAAVQDGYTLYHHTMLLAEDGSWAVVQQGMNPDNRMARRYHWLADSIESFVNEPHSGIISDSIHDNTLNMTSRLSEECRKTCVDIANSYPSNVISSVKRLPIKNSLDQWFESKPANIEAYAMPWKLDWDLFRKVYDVKPRNYEELIAIKGVGPSVVRALALVAELIYGARPSWNDPVKFSFAHGGKDGVPYPVDRRTYDKSVKILMNAIEGAEIERETRLKALKRLAAYSYTLFPNQPA
jgi:hypothetical protein